MKRRAKSEGCCPLEAEAGYNAVVVKTARLWCKNRDVDVIEQDRVPRRSGCMRRILVKVSLQMTGEGKA